MCEEAKVEFVKKVEHYNNATFGIPPFVFPLIGCYVAKKPPLPIYATYLYDSVMLYAKALAYVTSSRNVNGELIKSSVLMASAEMVFDPIWALRGIDLN